MGFGLQGIKMEASARLRKEYCFRFFFRVLPRHGSHSVVREGLLYEPVKPTGPSEVAPITWTPFVRRRKCGATCCQALATHVTMQLGYEVKAQLLHSLQHSARHVRVGHMVFGVRQHKPGGTKVLRKATLRSWSPCAHVFTLTPAVSKAYF